MKLNSKLLVIIASGAVTGMASADMIVADVADAEATSDGGTGAGNNQTILAGAYYGAGPGVVPVFAFQLPALGAGESFATATVALNLQSIAGTPGFNGDLIGLTRVSASPSVLGADWNGAGTMLQDNFMTSASATGLYTSTNFASWLNTQYASAAAGDFVFVSLDAEGTTGVGSFTGYIISSANNAVAANHPTLTYTAIPEPSSMALIGLAGVLALVLRRRRQ